MSRAMYNILKGMKKDRITQNYQDKGRYIPAGIYHKLKSKTKCDHCHKKFSGVIPEIHHIKALDNGGDNSEENLMAVHIKCHKVLDYAQGVGHGDRGKHNENIRNIK